MPDFLLPFLSVELGLPLVSSLLTGMLIGLDRELQGKPAGLRTHTLVCFASALLTLAAAHQNLWGMDLRPATQVVSDPTRMAHGILTGIGFLGAGVIFREGSSVHGLTTAASLWITAALGVVYGVGMFGLAFIGTAATLTVLIALRLLYAVLPRSTGLHLMVATPEGSGLDAEALRHLLAAHGLAAPPLSQSYDAKTRVIEFTTSTYSRSAPECDKLADAMRTHPAVLRFTMLLLDDAGAHDSGE